MRQRMWVESWVDYCSKSWICVWSTCVRLPTPKPSFHPDLPQSWYFNVEHVVFASGVAPRRAKRQDPTSVGRAFMGPSPERWPTTDGVSIPRHVWKQRHLNGASQACVTKERCENSNTTVIETQMVVTLRVTSGCTLTKIFDCHFGAPKCRWDKMLEVIMKYIIINLWKDKCLFARMYTAISLMHNLPRSLRALSSIVVFLACSVTFDLSTVGHLFRGTPRIIKPCEVSDDSPTLRSCQIFWHPTFSRGHQLRRLRTHRYAWNCH